MKDYLCGGDLDWYWHHLAFNQHVVLVHEKLKPILVFTVEVFSLRHS